MTEPMWQPIAKYKKGTPAVFLFEASTSRPSRPNDKYNRLPRLVHTSHVFGSRVCIAFCEIPKTEDFKP